MSSSSPKRLSQWPCARRGDHHPRCSEHMTSSVRVHGTLRSTQRKAKRSGDSQTCRFPDIPTPLIHVSMITTTLGIWQSGRKLDISVSGTKSPPRWEPSGRCAELDSSRVFSQHYSLESPLPPAGTNAGALGQNWVTSQDGTLQSYGREALLRSTAWAHLTDIMWSKSQVPLSSKAGELNAWGRMGR